MRQLVRRERARGAGLEVIRCSSEEVTRNRHHTIMRCLNASRFTLLSLQESLDSLDTLESSHALSMMILTRGSLFVESLLKSLVAYHDIQAAGHETGHALWHREEGRALISRHRLHRLFLLLQAHLRAHGDEAGLARVDEDVIRTLNTFGTIARYLASHHAREDLAVRYMALKGGAEAPAEERLYTHLKTLSSLSSSLLDAKADLYTPAAEALCRTLFPEAARSTWPTKIAEEIAAINQNELFPLIHRLLQTAHCLLQFHLEFLSNPAPA